MKNILILVSHPIQYHSPLFKYLSLNASYNVTVIYTDVKFEANKYDPDFQRKIDWGIDLYSGYNFEFNDNPSNSGLTTYLRLCKESPLVKRVRKLNPDLILLFGWRKKGHIDILRTFGNKIPIIFRGDSTALDDQNKYFIFKSIRYFILNRVYRNVKFVLSPGIASDHYYSKAGLNSSKIIRASHAVDNVFFSTLTQEEHDKINVLKEELKFSNNDVIFLFAGKFTRKKNTLLLIKAFCKLSVEYPNAKLLLVGNGPLSNTIEKQLLLIPSFISEKIQVLPFHNQKLLKLIYHLSSVFVLPSQGPRETWGLSVNESMAAGTPVIVSNKCGCAFDLIKQGVNGLVFESNKTEDLLDKMRMCCNNDYRNNLANNTLKSLEKYSFHSFKEALDLVISKC